MDSSCRSLNLLTFCGEFPFNSAVILFRWFQICLRNMKHRILQCSHWNILHLEIFISRVLSLSLIFAWKIEGSRQIKILSIEKLTKSRWFDVCSIQACNCILQAKKSKLTIRLLNPKTIPAVKLKSIHSFQKRKKEGKGNQSLKIDGSIGKETVEECGGSSCRRERTREEGSQPGMQRPVSALYRARGFVVRSRCTWCSSSRSRCCPGLSRSSPVFSAFSRWSSASTLCIPPPSWNNHETPWKSTVNHSRIDPRSIHDR